MWWIQYRQRPKAAAATHLLYFILYGVTVKYTVINSGITEYPYLIFDNIMWIWLSDGILAWDTSQLISQLFIGLYREDIDIFLAIILSIAYPQYSFYVLYIDKCFKFWHLSSFRKKWNNEHRYSCKFTGFTNTHGEELSALPHNLSCRRSERDSHRLFNWQIAYPKLSQVVIAVNTKKKVIFLPDWNDNDDDNGGAERSWEHRCHI